MWGAAMEVPLREAYVPSFHVLTTDTPEKARVTIDKLASHCHGATSGESPFVPGAATST
jgi:hypothetical protein